MKSTAQSFIDLTWDDLRQWAGVKILDRGKSYVQNVSDLACTEDGEWVAWVAGSEDYATSVEPDGHGEIDWFCTCPYDWAGPCKHAVAVILAGIEAVKAGKEMPLLDEESDLYMALLEDWDGYDDFFEEDDFDDEEPLKKDKDGTLAKILQKKRKDELVGLLLDLAVRYPQVRCRINEDEQLAAGNVDKLVQALRREIKKVTDEEAWFNPWENVGNLPDYTHIQEQLTALLKKGHADAVVELGRELWDRGNAQVEQSDDEGHTAEEIQKCMEIVFKAIVASSLAPPEQIIRMTDILLEDNFSISDGCYDYIHHKKYTKEHWRQVAELLEKRLAAFPKAKRSDYSIYYQRRRLMTRLVVAYKKSGQNEQIIPLYEKEVHATQNYNELIEAYLQSGQKEKAKAWCVEGFAKTIDQVPGIANGLRKTLREMAAKEKKFDLVAAYRAEEFFDRPCRNAYLDLQKAAQKIKLWPQVRAEILSFLQSGDRPATPPKGDWPLPPPEVTNKPGASRRDQFPDLDMLIDIAILEKRNDDVVTLYQEQMQTTRWGVGSGLKVAAAVVATHPDISLDLWKRVAVGKIKLVKPKAYEEAAVYLRKMRKVYQQTKRTVEWRQLLTTLRVEHKAKRRLMEVLDSLEGKRIID